MRFDSKHIRNVLDNKRMRLALAIVLAPLLGLAGGACVTLVQAPKAQPRADRGIKFNHEVHADALECDMCHALNDDGVGFASATHDTCNVCHDIPDDFPDEDTPPEENACLFCHRPDFSIDERSSVLGEDIKFAHGPHAEAEVACAACHEDPDSKPLPGGSLKPFCMDCHQERDPELNACAVCHKETDKDMTPRFRKGERIAHDNKAVWERIHGREALVDPEYCGLCHEQPNDCQSCHETEKPRDHTAAWRRRTHGVHAGWDRQRCATCHQEDYCIQCHRNSKPVSHRAGWGAPRDRHCVSCHFPPENTNCTVCHETIEHRSAPASPHSVGLYPQNCRTCHPGGLTNQAPHMQNSTVFCSHCHE